jgi:hypothetical protein
LKLGDQNRFAIIGGLLVVAAAFLVIRARRYGTRLLSIFIPSTRSSSVGGCADAPNCSRSFTLRFRHPFFGIGMGNYAGQMSLRGLSLTTLTTQVASEMGLFALGHLRRVHGPAAAKVGANRA